MSENKVLRLLREANGFTQEYVGSYLGIEQNTYSKLEKGQIRLTVERIHALSDLYKVSPDYFLADELQIVNHNTGEHSKSYTRNTFNNENFNESNEEGLKALYDRLLAEKDGQIAALKQELVAAREELRDTQKDLKELVHKLAGKL